MKPKHRSIKPKNNIFKAFWWNIVGKNWNYCSKCHGWTIHEGHKYDWGNSREYWYNSCKSCGNEMKGTVHYSILKHHGLV